jgi:DNA repair exonuclease SbcCD ATPase subunit
MRIVLCPGGGPAKSEDNEFYIEIGKISQRTSDIQTALEANRQSEAQTFQNLQAKIDENTASIKELTDRVNELSKQLSKMQNGDNKAEVSRELKDVRENIAALKQGLTKLQSDSSKKAIGLINVDASH